MNVALQSLTSALPLSRRADLARTRALEVFFAAAELVSTDTSGELTTESYRYADREHGASLDVIRLNDATRRPAVVYYHGGAFRSLSRRSHRAIARRYARAGYVVINVDYRLAPEYAYPAAHNDAAEAWAWVHDNAERLNVDPDFIAISGESAGANLATAVAAACVLPSEESWTRVLLGVPAPAALINACGVLQVTAPDRFQGTPLIGPIATRVLSSIRDEFLRDTPNDARTRLHDPVVALEQAPAALRRLMPPVFSFAGDRDPLIADARRLATTLDHAGASATFRSYPAGGHSFHAFPFSSISQQCWADQLTWLSEQRRTAIAARNSATAA